MKKILFTLLLTFTCLNISAQTKKIQDREYYIYTTFVFPSIEISKGTWKVPIINLINFEEHPFVSENNRPLLFDSGNAAQNYLCLQGWEEFSKADIFRTYKKRVTKEVLEREVEKSKSSASYEEVLNAYNRDINKYPSKAGYKMVEVEGQVDISEK